MSMVVHPDAVTRGKYAEALLLREIERVEPSDQSTLVFAETAVIELGNAEYEGDESWGQQVAWGNQALRILRLLPPASEQIVSSLCRKAPLPETRLRLWRFVFLALDASDREEHFMKFAGSLMHKKIVATNEDKKNFEEAARTYFANDINRRVWKFTRILRYFSRTPQAEHVLFRFMLRFVAKFGKANDFAELISPP